MPVIQIPAVGSIGLVADPYEQDLPPQAWSRVRNARFGVKGAQAFTGHEEVMEEAPITPLWIKYFPDREEPRWVFADNNKVYVWEDFQHTNITRFNEDPGDEDYNATERWQGALFNSIGILNNGFDAPQQWGPISRTTTLKDLENWPSGYRCRFIKPFKNFLIAGHVYDSSDLWPFRVHWSHPADPGTVPSSWAVDNPAVDAGHFDLGRTADHVVDGLEMGDLFVVYREETTYVMQLTGTSRVFRNREISGSSGILWKDCVVSLPQGHIVATWDDLVAHQGTPASFQSLIANKLARWISARRSEEYYKNSFLIDVRARKEVWYCFPETGQEYANLAVVFNTTNGQCGIRELPQIPFADAGPMLFEVEEE